MNAALSAALTGAAGFYAGAVWWEHWQGNQFGDAPKVLNVAGDIAFICVLWLCRGLIEDKP